MKELHVLTLEEEARLLAACGEPLRLLAIFALDGELRMTEMHGLAWRDVDLESGIITIRLEDSKIQTRKVPMTPRMIEEAQTLKTRATNDYVVPQFNFKTMWADALADAGLSHFPFWLLRRTAQIRKQLTQPI